MNECLRETCGHPLVNHMTVSEKTKNVLTGYAMTFGKCERKDCGCEEYVYEKK